MIKNIKSKVKSLFKYYIPPSEFSDKSREPDDVKKEETYTGVPAPTIPPTDSWFNKPTLSKKALDKQREIDHNKEVEAERSVESPDIHQEMYEMATKNWTTVKETKGWQSGTGYGQFRS